MNDIINGLFELLGAFFTIPSILKTMKAKKATGVSYITTGFFTTNKDGSGSEQTFTYSHANCPKDDTFLGDFFMSGGKSKMKQLITEEVIGQKIFLIRKQKVMIEFMDDPYSKLDTSCLHIYENE